MYSYFKLMGETATVTGAGNSIERGIIKVLVGLGINVVACDTEKENAEDVVEEIVSQGLFAVIIYYDVRKYEDIQNMIRTTVDTYGTVDIFVDGTTGCDGGVTIDDTTEEEWICLIELNLNSVYRFTMSAPPLMKAKKSGKIVNISPGAGTVGDLLGPHHVATKREVIAFPKEIVHEVAEDHINVNCAVSGLVDTRMARIGPWEDEITDTLWRRVGQPEDITYAAVYIASAINDYCTGQAPSPGGDAWVQQAAH